MQSAAHLEAFLIKQGVLFFACLECFRRAQRCAHAIACLIWQSLPWLWVVWQHTLAKSYCLLQFKHCFPQAGQTVEHWELVWFVVPQPEQCLEAFDLAFLYAEIQATESVCWCQWAWSQSADSNTSACLIILKTFKIFCLGKNACKVSLCNPCINWPFTWMDC